MKRNGDVEVMEVVDIFLGLFIEILFIVGVYFIFLVSLIFS